VQGQVAGDGIVHGELEQDQAYLQFHGQCTQMQSMGVLRKWCVGMTAINDILKGIHNFGTLNLHMVLILIRRVMLKVN